MTDNILTFPTLLKKIRSASKMNQQEMADTLGVSKVLIAMLESDMKEPSKKFTAKLAELLKVHPLTLMPFIVLKEGEEYNELSAIEKNFIQSGVKLQDYLITKQAKKLVKNV